MLVQETASALHPEIQWGALPKLSDLNERLSSASESMSCYFKSPVLYTVKAQQLYPEKQAMQGAAALMSWLPQGSADLAEHGPHA